MMKRSMHSLPAGFAALICALSGLSVGFCFWPYRTGFLAFFVLVPFLIFSGLKDGRGRFLLNSFVFGFCYFIGSLYWIAMLDREQITIPWLRLPAAVVLCLYLSLFILFGGFLMRRAVKLGVPYVIAVPVVWGGIEYLRSLGPLGFPWASMGYSQTPYLGIIQIAAAVGTYGLSAWIVLVNGLLASFIVSRRLSRLVAAVLVFVIPALAGQLALTDAEPHDGVRLSLIQPSISGSVKWDEAYRDSTMRLLTRMTLESPGSRMVVWPETAVPFYIEHVPSALGDVAVLAEHTGSSILFGFPDYEHTEAGERYYNSAMLITSEGEVAGKYSKIHLVPFGEMFPFEDRIELLRRINLGEGDFSPGEEHTIFEIDGRRFGVAICFESIYPGLVREFVRDGADFIVNVTNDEWFGPSLGPYQHAQMAIMRAVEYRIGVARCANTGISMFVDPFGRVTSKTDLFTRRILTGDVTFSAGRTSYLRVGRVIETGLLLVSLVLGGLSFLARRARRNSLTP